MTVRMVNIPAERQVGGTGTWEITAGTGAYAKLRGSGTWGTLAVHGDEGDVTTLTFRSRMRGSPVIDDVAPEAGFSKARARKLARP